VPSTGVSLAVYGAFKDVTKKLKENMGTTITVNNATFDGDPAPGIAKRVLFVTNTESGRAGRTAS